MHKLSFVPKNVIVAVSLATLIVHVIKSCPLVCTCKWKGGKRKVECVDKNLTGLLADIDAETQVLDYGKNRLRQLEARLFERASLIHLQKLYVAECRIGAVHEAAFRGLANLIELDMSANELLELPAFGDLPLLMKLVLAANPIRALRAAAFRPLRYLATLDLSDCRLETVDANAFDGLHKLEWLRLEGNRLRALKSPHTLPAVGSGLSLQRNPWRCDCHLRNFQRWLTNDSSGASPRRLVVEPVCVEPPAYRGVQVVRLKIDDLACAPYVVPSSLFVEIDEGKNISFVCQVSAVPEAQITWDFEGNPVSSNSSLVYPFYKYYAEEATTEQVSELFVFDAKKENNGTYRCTAHNAAGTSTSNYTLNVIVLETEAPQTLTVSHLHVIFSSVGTLVVVVFVVLLVILCLIYVNHKKGKQRRSTKRTESKSATDYEIIKQTSSLNEPSGTNHVAAAAGKTDANPDLLVNTEGHAANGVLGPPCERLLLLPADAADQAYLTLASNSLVNGGAAIYEGNNGHDHYSLQHPHHDTPVALIPAQVVPPTERGSIIKLYLAPSTPQKFRNLHVNPLDGYVEPVEQSCWTLELADDDDDECAAKMRHVLIDCYSSQTVCPKSHPAALSNTSEDDYINLRHNLEGYPYPSKLKLKALKAEQMNGEIVNTPILSPPDPFKTGTEIPPVETTVSL